MLPEALGLPHLCPGVSFNLGELELCVVGVHLSDLFPGWCSQHLQEKEGSEPRLLSLSPTPVTDRPCPHLDDLHQLVYPAVPREDGLAQEELGQYTAS